MSKEHDGGYDERFLEFGQYEVAALGGAVPLSLRRFSSATARLLTLAVVVLIPTAVLGIAAQKDSLTKEEMQQFLRSAKVTKAFGTDRPDFSHWRLTLTDGRMTHDAVLNFPEGYRHDFAAYRVAELLGLGHMAELRVRRPTGLLSQAPLAGLARRLAGGVPRESTA